MKKAILFIVFMLILSVGVFAANNVTVNFNSAQIPDPFTINLQSGQSQIPLTLTLTNSGPNNYTNVKIFATFPNLQDSNGNVLTIQNPTPIGSLLQGASSTVNFYFNVDSGFEVSTLTGVLVVQSDQFNGANAENHTFELNVKPLACLPNAKKKQLDFDINKPQDGDNFNPEDTITTDIDINNNNVNKDVNARLTAILYNEDKNKRIDSYTTRENINSDETQNVNFDLSLGDIRNNNARLYVKVEDVNDASNCELQDVSLDIKIPKHQVNIVNPSISPQTASCGDRVSGSALLRNIGSNDEAVTFDVYSSQLGISQTSQSFTLHKSTSDNEQVINFGFNVPQGSKDGVYSVFFRARYSGFEQLAVQQLTVQGCNTYQQQQQNQIQQDNTSKTVVITSNNDQAPPPASTYYTQKGFFDAFNSNGSQIPTSVWILVNVLLVVLIIAALVYLFRR